MKRVAFVVYGLLAYILFIGTFLYTAGFLTNLFVPKSIDSAPTSSPDTALAANLLLLALFAVQHSGMARTGFKRVWTQIVPEPIERSTHAFFSCFTLIAVMTFWQPIEGTLWHFESGLFYWIGLALFSFGIGLILYTTALIDHSKFFGLRQVFAALHGKTVAEDHFTTPSLYRFIRHPLYVGWFIVLWATPSMSAGHLLFATACTGYVLLAVRYEEHDLIQAFGRTYQRYQRSTPMFIPSTGASTGQGGTAGDRIPQEVTRTISL